MSGIKENLSVLGGFLFRFIYAKLKQYTFYIKLIDLFKIVIDKEY